MKEMSLFVGLMGIIFLILIINFSNPVRVNSQKEIDSLIENQKVIVSGVVQDQKQYSNYYIIYLDKNLSLYYYGKDLPNLKDKKITSVGTIDTYLKNKVKVLQISYSN